MCKRSLSPKREELFEQARRSLNHTVKSLSAFTALSISVTKQLSRKLQLPLPFRRVQKILFNTLTLRVRQFIVNVLVRHFIDGSVKLLAKRRIRQQTELNSLLVCLLQLAEQISPNLVLQILNDDAAP